MKPPTFLENQNRHVRFLLGLYIARKRSELGISIPELASQISLNPESLKRIESGKKNLTVNEFCRLQSQLNLEYDDLIEIHRIASVAYVNDIAKAIVPNYPS